MHTYRVWFDDGSAILVNARTPDEATRIAETMYTGSNAVKTERIS